METLIFVVVTLLFALTGYFGGACPNDKMYLYILFVLILALFCPLIAYSILPEINLIAVICFEMIGLIAGAVVHVLRS